MGERDHWYLKNHFTIVLVTLHLQFHNLLSAKKGPLYNIFILHRTNFVHLKHILVSTHFSLACWSVVYKTGPSLYALAIK